LAALKLSRDDDPEGFRAWVEAYRDHAPESRLEVAEFMAEVKTRERTVVEERAARLSGDGFLVGSTETTRLLFCGRSGAFALLPREALPALPFPLIFTFSSGDI